VSRNLVPYSLVTWLVLAAFRVALGPSTSFVAYLFFGVFWLISAVLLAAAIRQLIRSQDTEPRTEAVCICAGLVSVFVQGLLGPGATSGIALATFGVSALILLVIYARRLGRKGLA
jgi:succinate-acetate transporter protein